MSSFNLVVLLYGPWTMAMSADPRTEFEVLWLHGAHPTLRSRDLPLAAGAEKLGPISLRYTSNRVVVPNVGHLDW